MKRYYIKEKHLSKKVEQLETRLNENKTGTSRFGTGKLMSNMEQDDIERLTMSD